MRGETTAEGAGGDLGEAQAPPKSEAPQKKKRDPRLDFFRGLGMFIILIAHIPWNTWNRWIPARFGFSDATEIFVFCSGAASAIAFLRIFNQRGWGAGAARICYRIWQLYWCHLAVFFTVLTSLIVVDGYLGEGARSHVGVLNLARFVDAPADFLPHLFALTYVPNLFDILAMYMVILAMIPFFIALGWVRPWVAMAASVAVWAAASQPWLAFVDVPVFTGFNLPAEPIGRPRTWFFNPFAWQLIFFTGFVFAVGWLPAPPVRKWLIGLCLAIVLISAPFDPDGVPIWRLLNSASMFEPVKDAVVWFKGAAGPLLSKTFFGLFRYAHFLALAYLVWVAAGEGGSRLPQTGIGGAFVRVVRRVGQQSLAVFIVSLVISRLLGVWIDEAGREDNMVVMVAANLVGFAILIAVAYLARYFRNPPWAKKA